MWHKKTPKNNSLLCCSVIKYLLGLFGHCTSIISRIFCQKPHYSVQWAGREPDKQMWGGENDASSSGNQRISSITLTVNFAEHYVLCTCRNKKIKQSTVLHKSFYLHFYKRQRQDFWPSEAEFLPNNDVLTNNGHHISEHVSFGHFIQTSLERRKHLLTFRVTEEQIHGRWAHIKVNIHESIAWS